MKTTLSHLRYDKQEQLKTLTEIIVSKVPAEMIILFGSHARGDWVEDFHKIENAELDYLSERVKLLKELTERICKERIEQFTKE